jgi:hypothetical protein
MLLFDVFVVTHVISGATGLVIFWVPVIARKGAHHHRKWGRLFAYSMIATGISAIAMGLCTLVAPLPTHPELTDVPLIRGLFGWMMLYLAILTIGLAWHGLMAVRNKSDHRANRHWSGVSLQVLTIIAAVNCAVQGFIIEEYLMVGVATAGLASAGIYLHFMFRDQPPRMEFLMQHFQASLGAGISVYTAFLAFGAVRLFPHHAFNPAMWAVPTIVGAGLMIFWRLKHMNIGARRGLASSKASSSGDLA